MKKTPLVRYFAYACPDIGGQLIFCVVSFYLLKFYTDVYGLSAATAGTILLVARCVDAVDAPVWGVIFDKTRSRWGKHRPWFLWLCVPFALSGVAMFATPDLGPVAKVIYAGGTYMICSILYTGINTPVTSILVALTGDSRERVVFTSFRMFGSKLGVLIVNLTMLKLVEILGGGNDRKGFTLVLTIYAVCAVALFLFAFSKLEERQEESTKSVSILDGFRALKTNWMWMLVFASNLCFWIAFVARISVAPYFWEYTMHRKDLVGMANSLDFVSLIGIFLLPWLVRLSSKHTVWLLSLAGSVAAQFLVWQGVAQQSVPVVMAGWIAGVIASGVAMAIPFSVLSDCVDYGEWKTGVRAAGLLTAVGAAFCLKAGGGIGGALPAWILDWSGYVPNVEQTSRALGGIDFGFIWLPAVFYLLAAVPVFFYRRYERLESQVRQELELRRQGAVVSASA
jgi:sugar (glycoside-pentoside-hexuronide) transporter